MLISAKNKGFFSHNSKVLVKLHNRAKYQVFSVNRSQDIGGGGGESCTLPQVKVKADDNVVLMIGGCDEAIPITPVW